MFNPYQANFSLTSQLICTVNQLTGFYLNEILTKEYMNQGSRLNLIQISFSGMGSFMIGVMLPCSIDLARPQDM